MKNLLKDDNISTTEYTDKQNKELIESITEASHAFSSSMKDLSKGLEQITVLFQNVIEEMGMIFYKPKKKWYVRLKEKFKKGDKNEKKSRTNS